MHYSIGNDFSEETPEAKARWFQSLSYEQRMNLLCEFTELIFSMNPRIADTKDAQATDRNIPILSLS